MADAGILASLILLGAAIRIGVAGQSMWADELSTYWISVNHSLGGVLSLLYGTGAVQHAEITPPLSFVATWLTSRLGHSPELVRLPALLAGLATIPTVYGLGARTVGRRAGLIAAALTTLSPFMIYYSAEARAYGLLMFLTTGAILSLVTAAETGRRRWWITYSALAAAAFYTHYTCVFVLAVALLWVLWSAPGARRAALLATVGAGLLILPWVPGLIADLRSPTLTILSSLSTFTPSAIRIDLEHWALGYPYIAAVHVAGEASGSLPTGLAALPGTPALILDGVAVLLTGVGLTLALARGGWRATLDAVRPGDAGARPGGWRTRPPQRWAGLFLVVGLLLATPVGEIIASSIGNHIFGVRDLAASWPFLALTASAALVAAGPRLSLVAAGLVVVAFGLGAARMLEARFGRPNYRAAAAYLVSHARPGEVILDATGPLSPGPLTGLDIALGRRFRVVRALSPAEHEHPFSIFDGVVPLPSAEARAIALARGARILLVGTVLANVAGLRKAAAPAMPGGYRLTTLRLYSGILDTSVAVYARAPARPR